MELRKIKMFLVVMAMLLCFSCEREVYISDKMYLRQMNYKEQSNNEVKGSFFYVLWKYRIKQCDHSQS